MNVPRNTGTSNLGHGDQHTAELRQMFGGRSVDIWYFQGARPGNPPERHPIYNTPIDLRGVRERRIEEPG